MWYDILIHGMIIVFLFSFIIWIYVTYDSDVFMIKKLLNNASSDHKSFYEDPIMIKLKETMLFELFILEIHISSMCSCQYLSNMNPIFSI